MEQVRLTREELYELVWNVPVSVLARRYATSDVALAQTCARLRIPRPGRGYWARRRAGKRCVRISLPTWSAQDAHVVLVPRDNPLPPDQHRKGSTVVVPASLSGAHKAVRALGRALKSAELDEFDRLVLTGPGSLTFATTVDLHRRALLLLQGLAHAMTERGHAVRFEASALDQGSTPGRTQRSGVTLIFDVSGESIDVAIVEPVVRVPYQRRTQDDLGEHADLELLPKTMQVPSGRLEIRIYDAGPGRVAWRDWSKRRLDDALGEIVLALEEAAQRRQRCRDIERCEQERRNEEARLRREEAARREREDQMIAHLKRAASDWADACRIRAFLEALEKAVPVEERDPSLNQWLTWARTYNQGTDPRVHLRS